MSPQDTRTYRPPRDLPGQSSRPPPHEDHSEPDSPDEPLFAAEDDIENDSPPPLLRVPTPWETGGSQYVDRLEQYLVLVIEGHEHFFRVSFWVERTTRGLRPSVFVELMTGVPAIGEDRRNILLFLSMDLQAGLVRELERAIRGRFGGIHQQHGTQ